MRAEVRTGNLWYEPFRSRLDAGDHQQEQSDILTVVCGACGVLDPSLHIAATKFLHKAAAAHILENESVYDDMTRAQSDGCK